MLLLQKINAFSKRKFFVNKEDLDGTDIYFPS